MFEGILHPQSVRGRHGMIYDAKRGEFEAPEVTSTSKTAALVADGRDQSEREDYTLCTLSSGTYTCVPLREVKITCSH